MALAEDSSASAAWNTLRLVTEHPQHEFWEEGFAYSQVPHKGVQGPKQVTDAWLAALARKRGGRLASLDAPLHALHSDVAKRSRQRIYRNAYSPFATMAEPACMASSTALVQQLPYQAVFTGYRAMLLSFARSTRPSTRAWPISSRSNGSRWRQGSFSLGAQCSRLIGSSNIRFVLLSSANASRQPSARSSFLNDSLTGSSHSLTALQ